MSNEQFDQLRDRIGDGEQISEADLTGIATWLRGNRHEAFETSRKPAKAKSPVEAATDNDLADLFANSTKPGS